MSDMPDQAQRQHQEQTQELHQIQDQQQKMDTKLNALIITSEQMLFQLVGNELDKESGGLIKKVNNLEKEVVDEVARLEIRIASIEKTRDRLFVALVVLSFCTGITFWDVIQKFLK